MGTASKLELVVIVVVVDMVLGGLRWEEIAARRDCADEGVVAGGAREVEGDVAGMRDGIVGRREKVVVFTAGRVRKLAGTLELAWNSAESDRGVTAVRLLD